HTIKDIGHSVPLPSLSLLAQARQRRSVLLGPNQDECDLDGLVAFVPPGMSRSVLNDDVVRFQMNFLSVVQLKPHLAFENDAVVDRLGGVHTRTVRLHRGRQVWDVLSKLLEPRDRIDAHHYGIRSEGDNHQAGLARLLRQITALLQDDVSAVTGRGRRRQCRPEQSRRLAWDVFEGPASAGAAVRYDLRFTPLL